MTFVGNLLGIDLDLGIGIGIGGGKDKGRDKGRNKGKTPPGVRDWTLSWEELVLYGDDGYEKRPVPEGCPKLEFENQMIWDQQGNRGGEFTNDSAPKARRDLKTDGADDKKETVEIVKGSTPSSEATTEETKVVPESGDDKTVNKAPTEEDTKPSEGGDKGTTPTDIKEDDKKDTKKVKPDGIQICLLGPCDNDDDDRDKDGDDERPRHHRIYHKQKRFLKQYRGRALRIDSVTKCPLPGTA
ncbi:hypothetical protein B0O80DRAFT_448830 [Mortierella sp. GBAus27b]|nr:hypothetical protein B0O80DRAFT_448830 [Mortierella sp. GBAus27b]